MTDLNCSTYKLAKTVLTTYLFVYLEDLSQKYRTFGQFMKYVLTTGCPNSSLYVLNSSCDLDFELWVNYSEVPNKSVTFFILF